VAASERGTAVLIVEQHVRKVLKYADRVYVMRRGRVEMALSAKDALSRLVEIEDNYLAGGTPEIQTYALYDDSKNRVVPSFDEKSKIQSHDRTPAIAPDEAKTGTHGDPRPQA